MRGISPKQEVPRDAWQVHLANKIKYHWRPLTSECAQWGGAWRAAVVPSAWTWRGVGACHAPRRQLGSKAVVACGLLPAAATPPYASRDKVTLRSWGVGGMVNFVMGVGTGAATFAACPPRCLFLPAGGIHCPFKPDKYFEAYTYARLSAVDRWAWGRARHAAAGPGLAGGFLNGSSKNACIHAEPADGTHRPIEPGCWIAGPLRLLLCRCLSPTAMRVRCCSARG